MSRLCLDTSAYSRFQRGDQGAIELIDAAAWVGMPAVVLGELRAGFLLGGRPDMNESLLRQFLANPVVDVLSVDEDVSRHYADIVLHLRRAGTPIPTNDIWIAATAASAGATVLSDDAHFGAVSRVGSVLLGDAPRGD
jgi:tRNA(fMet)-specific endonuclease VapC